MPEQELLRYLDFFHEQGVRIWENEAGIYYTARMNSAGHIIAEWAWEHGYLKTADWYSLLKLKGTLPLMQRMHAAGILSLEVQPEQHSPTPVQQLIIIAAPPVDDHFSMEDALLKLEWMLANGANPNAMPHRHAPRGNERYRPLTMCRRIQQLPHLQHAEAWQPMERLLLQYGAR